MRRPLTFVALASVFGLPLATVHAEPLPFNHKVEVYRGKDAEGMAFCVHLEQPFLADEFEKSNYLRLEALDRNAYLIYPKETKFQQKHAEFYGRLRGSGKARLRLSYEMVSENPDGSRKVEVRQGEIEVAIPAKEGGPQSVYRQWAERQNAYFLHLLRLYPHESFYQYALLQSHDRYGVTPPDLGAVLPPESDADLQGSLYEVFTGSLAVQESLQRHALRAGPAAGNLNVHISQLSPPALSSLPYAELLEKAQKKGLAVKTAPIARLVPEDQYFLHFRSIKAAYELGDLAAQWGDDLLRLFVVQARDNRIEHKFADQLCLRRGSLTRFFADRVVSELAITGSDPYVREGTDVTILFRLQQPEAFDKAAAGWLAEVKGKRKDVEEREFNYRGHKIAARYTADRVVSSFVARHEDYAIYSNSHRAIRKVVDTLLGLAPRLSDALDYRYVSTILPPSDDPQSGYLFASEAFLRRQVGPALKISEKRRVQCFNNLVMLNNAALFYRLEHGRSPGSLTDLVEGRFVDPSKLVCPHGGAYAYDAGQDGCSCCEELFTECEDAEAREAFLANLDFAASQPDRLVSVIFTLRSDFASAIPLSSAFGRAVRERPLPVQAMSRGELARAIEQPAQELGCPWPQALVERLVDQVEGRAGALPLLQFALQQLWPKHAAGRLDSLGSTQLIEDFLTDAADELFSAADAGDQRITRRAFLAMVQLGEGTADTRRVARLSEFMARGEEPEHVRQVLEPYTDPVVRLVTASEQEGEPTYELTHEALITSWGRLRMWLGNVSDKPEGDRIRRDLRLNWRLAIAAAEWEEGRGGLWRPPELTILQDYRTRSDADLTRRQWAFAEASEAAWKQEQERAQRERNRIRVGLAVVSLLLVISIAAGIVATVFWRTTSTTLSSLRLESARRLSIQGQQFLDAGNIDQSATSLLEAAKLLTEAGGGTQTTETFTPSVVRTISTIAQKPLPIPARRDGILLVSPFDDTLVVSAAKERGLIEIWKAPDPAQVRRVATIDVKSPLFYAAIDIGRHELYTFVVGETLLKRWSLADGSLLGEVRSPVLPKDYKGAVDFRPHLGGLLVFDGEHGIVFEPTLGTVTPAGPKILAEFESERFTEGDIDRLRDLVSAGPSQDVVGETQFALREFAEPLHLEFQQSCRYAVSGANDGVLKIWDVKSGTLAKSIEIGDRISAVSISSTCDMVASFGLRSGIIVISLLDSSKRYRIYSKERYDHFAFDESGSFLLLFDEAESFIVPVQLPTSIARNANVLSDVIDFVPSKDQDHYLVRTIKPTRGFEPWVSQYYSEDEPSGKLYFSARDAKTLQPRCTAHVDYPEDAVSALKVDEQKTFTSADPIDKEERERVNRVIDGKVVLINGVPCSYFLIGIAHHVYALELIRDTEPGRWEWKRVASLHSGYRNAFPNHWTFHDVSFEPGGIALYTDDGWRLFRRDPGNKSWTSVALEDRHFGVRHPASPNDADLDADANGGLPSLNYLGLLRGPKDLVVLSSSMETLIVDDQGRTKAKFRPASNCRQIIARTTLGDLIIQEYGTGEDNGCKPQSSLINPEGLSLHPISTGYLATPEQSGSVFLRVEDKRLALVDSVGRVRCEFPRGALANVEIYYPTVSQIDARARMRVLAGGFYFGPAWHARRSKTKIVMMEEAGYFAAATNDAVIVYRLMDCTEVGRAAVDKPFWSAVPVPNSSLFVTANGDRSYSIWDARTISEVFRGSGVAQIRNVIGNNANVFSVEGIRKNLNFLRVDRTALTLARQGSATLVQKLRNWVDGDKQDTK